MTQFMFHLRFLHIQYQLWNVKEFDAQARIFGATKSEKLRQ